MSDVNGRATNIDLTHGGVFLQKGCGGESQLWCWQMPVSKTQQRRWFTSSKRPNCSITAWNASINNITLYVTNKTLFKKNAGRQFKCDRWCQLFIIKDKLRLTHLRRCWKKTTTLHYPGSKSLKILFVCSWSGFITWFMHRTLQLLGAMWSVAGNKALKVP